MWQKCMQKWCKMQRAAVGMDGFMSASNKQMQVSMLLSYLQAHKCSFLSCQGTCVYEAKKATHLSKCQQADSSQILHHRDSVDYVQEIRIVAV